MFARVPVLFTINIMLNHLRNNGIHQDIVQEFETLLHLCLEDNICHFRGKTYRFPDGLPMGDPLSNLAADVYMTHMEYTISSFTTLAMWIQKGTHRDLLRNSRDHHEKEREGGQIVRKMFFYTSSLWPNKHP